MCTPFLLSHLFFIPSSNFKEAFRWIKKSLQKYRIADIYLSPSSPSWIVRIRVEQFSWSNSKLFKYCLFQLTTVRISTFFVLPKKLLLDYFLFNVVLFRSYPCGRDRGSYFGWKPFRYPLDSVCGRSSNETLQRYVRSYIGHSYNIFGHSSQGFLTNPSNNLCLLDLYVFPRLIWPLFLSSVSVTNPPKGFVAFIHRPKSHTDQDSYGHFHQSLVAWLVVWRRHVALLVHQ